MNNTLRINAIKKLILEQEKIEQEKAIEIEATAAKLEEFQVELEFLKKHIEQLKQELEVLGVQYSPLLSTSINATDTSNLSLSQAGTYQILAELDNPKGVQVKDVILHYKNLRILTHSRLIGEHFLQLVEEHKIYQINPENQRGRRYRIIKS